MYEAIQFLIRKLVHFRNVYYPAQLLQVWYEMIIACDEIWDEIKKNVSKYFYFRRLIIFIDYVVDD